MTPQSDFDRIFGVTLAIAVCVLVVTAIAWLAGLL